MTTKPTAEPMNPIQSQPDEAAGQASHLADVRRAFDSLFSTADVTSEPAWLTALRGDGLAKFIQDGCPTRNDEHWRYTSLEELHALPFQPVTHRLPCSVTQEFLSIAALGGLAGPRLVFVDGHFVPELSATNLTIQGALLTNLATAIQCGQPRIETHLNQRRDQLGDGAFSDLNTAFFKDGGVVVIPAGAKISDPIRLVFVASGNSVGDTIHPRNIVVAGQGSQAIVIEHYLGLGVKPTFTNTVTDMVVNNGAILEYIKLQEETDAAFHIASLRAFLEADCNLACHSFALGSKLARQNIMATLDGKGINAVFNGLSVGDDERLIDYHVSVDHAQPQCASHEYFNGVLADKSKGVFYGRIRVRPGAQKTDAKQTNKNLILSDLASAHTRPQLEIHADDVKCTHGATIGQLDTDSIFYLRCRGIPADAARRMLIHAFASEIIDRVHYTPARETLCGLVWDRVERDLRVAAQL